VNNHASVPLSVCSLCLSIDIAASLFCTLATSHSFFYVVRSTYKDPHLITAQVLSIAAEALFFLIGFWISFDICGQIRQICFQVSGILGLAPFAVLQVAWSTPISKNTKMMAGVLCVIMCGVWLTAGLSMLGQEDFEEVRYVKANGTTAFVGVPTIQTLMNISDANDGDVVFLSDEGEEMCIFKQSRFIVFACASSSLWLFAGISVCNYGHPRCNKRNVDDQSGDLAAAAAPIPAVVPVSGRPKPSGEEEDDLERAV